MSSQIVEMGNRLNLCGLTISCINDDTTLDNFFIIPGLSGPDGKVVSSDGLCIDFTAKTVYKSRLIQIEFVSNLSGRKGKICQCLHVPNLPLTARVEDIEEAFKKSSRNVLHVATDNIHFYEGKVTVCIDDTCYDLGEYLLLREFARFQPISRSMSPKFNTPVVRENVLTRIDLTKESEKTEKKDEEFISPENRIIFIHRDSVGPNKLNDLPLAVNTSSESPQPGSPKNEGAAELTDKLEIIENKF